MEEYNNVVINGKEYARTNRIITSIETKESLRIYVDKDGNEYSLSDRYDTNNINSINIKGKLIALKSTKDKKIKGNDYSVVKGILLVLMCMSYMVGIIAYLIYKIAKLAGH